jgi:catechol 2,3-dioxygenase-like lactoylglutathione lyase family enzyme
MSPEVGNQTETTVHVVFQTLLCHLRRKGRKNQVFQKLECVCVHTTDIDGSLAFYTALGLTQAWRIERGSASGASSSLIGLKFPDAGSSELVLSNNPDVTFTEIEIYVGDVVATYETLKANPAIGWIRTPFATESGHVAVMEAPDGNVFVLVGK